MRWLLTSVFLLSALTAAPAQTTATSAISTSTDDTLPDAPGETTAQRTSVAAAADASFKANNDGLGTCNAYRAMKLIYVNPNRFDEVPKPCSELVYPYQRFLATDIIIPMTWQQKGYLALHNVSDLANITTIVGISAITVGINAHTAYGPGIKGFATSAGVSLSQDATGQLFGTFLIPTLVHEDPRYFRMPQASIQRRIFYSISRTFVSQHDDGSPMPNYSTFATYTIASELANLYVPGIHPDGVSTISRIGIGLATDPANNLLNEFLPDVAKRVHVRIIFVQRILNNVAGGTGGGAVQ